MILTLENEFLRVALNTFGGAIESMVNKRTGTDHYWHYDPAVWPRRTAICFPICTAWRCIHASWTDVYAPDAWISTRT